MSRFHLRTLGFVLAAVAGAYLVLFATSEWGVGVNGDSVTYIDTARNLLNGHGMVMFSHQCDYVPATRFAPLYPYLLAALGKSGFDLYDGARWLNAILFGANILLAGKILSEFARGSLWLPWLGAFLFLTSPDLLAVHAMAWTEPFFIFCAMLALVLLTRALQDSDRVLLLASASVTAIAFLTRFAGAGLIGAGVVAILLLSRWHYRARTLDAGIFLLISALPMMVWAIGSAVRGVPISEARGIAFHPITQNNALYAMATMGAWVFPESVLMRFGLLFLGSLGAFLILSNLEQFKKRIPDLSVIFMIFLLVYGVFLVISVSVFDASTPIDARILAPAHVAALILLLALAYRSWTKTGSPYAIHLILITIAFGLALLNLQRAVTATSDIHSNGQEFSGKLWRQSTLFEWIRQSNPATRIYSNADEVIYYLTGRQACRLPVFYNEKTLAGNPNYPSELAKLADELNKGTALIVYLTGREYRIYIPTPVDISTWAPLKPILQTPQGAVYQAETMR